MKNTPFFPFCSALAVTVLLLISSCINGIAPDESNIKATIRSFSTDAPLPDVVVVTRNGNVSEYDTTAASGTITLPNVQDTNTYSFEKSGYLTQTVKFEEFAGLTALEVYLKTSTSTATQTNLCGKVKDAKGTPVGNTTVSCNGDTTRSRPDGSYSFDISGVGSPFPITYSKGGINTRVQVTAPQDTIEVDVFIDGITPDTLDQKGG